MTELIKAELRMDSREIAELTGKKHSHVCRDVREMLTALNVNQSKYGSVYIDAKGENRNCFMLPYRETMLLVSGYSVPLRAKIIDRWIELEKKQKPSIPQTYSEALRLAADQAEKLAIMAPKADFYDAVTGSNDTIDMSQVAKTLDMGIGRNKLFELLRSKKILDNRNQPYQAYVDRGYFRIIESKYQKPDGSTHISLKTVVYQRGLDFIRRQLEAV